MTKKTIHIEAIDTLFFRDGKPFSMGEDVWAEGVFPPLPSVIYGALRSAYAFQQISKSKKTFEEAISESSNLEIHNIYLVTDTQEAFPFPQDLVKFKESQNGRKIYFLTKKEFQCSSSNSSTLLMLDESLKAEKLDELAGTGFLPKNDFEEYLLANKTEVKNVRKLSEHLTSEPKIGIGRDNETRTTSGEAEGKMYRVGMQRLEKWSMNSRVRLVVVVSGLEDLENNSIIKFGADGKTAKYSIGTEYIFKLEANDIQTNELKLYLSTPSIFQNTNEGKGILPQWLIEKNFEGIYVELTTYAVGKPQYIGGFDMKEQKPKRMFKAVPAGSVYYLQTKTVEDARTLAEKLQAQKSIAENGNEPTENFSEQGFGKFYLGLVQS
jgi:CRISPR-associated protein Cmr3